MYKILKADRDSYLTNKVVRGERKTSANVGQAGSLDLYKLYGATSSGSIPNTELSRILVHFDLEPLKDMVSAGELDPSASSFSCKLRLRDVYGGQPTPSNFTVSVFPLSASFEEGLGKDVVYLSDYDACNWISSSVGTNWFVTGCALAGGSTGTSDYLTSSTTIPSTLVSQVFKTGEEDLVVDVTTLVSATLAGEIPDSGFRISFDNSLEANTRSYFIKRFGSRHAYDETKHPSLLVGFDDSVTDDSQNLTLDVGCKINLYNYAAGNLANIVSGSSLTPVTGSNCIILKLTTPVSGGTYDLYFTGSQLTYECSSVPSTGMYTATATIPSSAPQVVEKLSLSSSISFTPIWTSLDGTTSYVTGSALSAYPATRSGSRVPKKYVVGVVGMSDSYQTTEQVHGRVHIFDESSPLVKVTKVPVELPGVVVKNVYYQVRDATTDEVVMPFDETTDATKVSSDSEGMFFKFDADSLIAGKTYVVDVLISRDGHKLRYASASPVFRVEKYSDAS